MTTAGPNSPGTMARVSDGGAVAWSNWDDAKTSDNAYATALIASGDATTWILQATNFGFAIPTGATINGVAVSVERRAISSTGSYVVDHTIKLYKGGVLSGDNKADTTTKWPTSDGSVSYGGAADLFGITLTADDVNAADFGVGLKSRLVRSGKGLTYAYVDHITITVTYTEGGGAPASVPRPPAALDCLMVY
ncbi:MAG: hypothetical protein GX465_15765 [Acidobacteria bacterium]|nr:hypothetical protein [Acidobacteriota bacterium]